MDGPRIGDAFGELLQVTWAEQIGAGPRLMLTRRVSQPPIEVVEWDNGVVTASLARQWFAPEDDWFGCERRALRHIKGPVLDVGAGAGRLCLALQARGIPVTGLDTSPGAVAVARQRGVRDVVCTTVDDHVAAGHRYRTFAFFGANLGLLQSRERAPVLLAALAAMATPDARIVGHGMDPHPHANPVQRAHHQRNVASGRLPGQLRLRVRFLATATPWMDFLLCSVAELEDLLAGTGWQLAEVDEADQPLYCAVLRRVGPGR